MMSSNVLRFVVTALCLCAMQAHGSEPEWVRGAVAITHWDEGLELKQLGGSEVSVSTASLPQYLGGLWAVDADYGERLLLKASNSVLLDYRGSGYLSIERFEQSADFTGDWLASEKGAAQSRMIINLRAGWLLLDQQKLNEASQLTVETPVGRIIAKKHALWMIELTKDERKKTYRFEVQCVDGIVRLVDLTGRTFTIRSGQRISGAGAAGSPSVEVAEITSAATEYFESYSSRAAEVTALDLSQEALLAVTVPLIYRQSTSVEELVIDQMDLSDPQVKRPFAIEYSARAAPVTEFKGVARPPSAYEVDLF